MLNADVNISTVAWR